MKNQKGITLVALVVTIIILIILAGISINLVLGDNGIITIAKKAKENTELAKTEEEKALNDIYRQLETEGGNSGGNTSSDDTIAKLAEFKLAIANAIDEAGGIKPEVTAETSAFADNIKGILKEVTKDATATADNISEGMTAWVNGELITGTGADNKEYSIKVISSFYNGKAITESLGTTGCSSSAHNNQGSWYLSENNFNYEKTLNLYETPDKKMAALNIINFNISCSSSNAYDNTWGRYNMSYSVVTDTNKTLDSGSISGSNGQSASKAININLFTAQLGDAKEINIKISGNTSARAATHKDSQGRANITVNNIYATYLPIE